MTHEQFIKQMDRLVATFGDRAYPAERLKVIHAAVADMPGEWMERTVSRFIGECRQAPLMVDFRLALAEERERTNQNKKLSKAIVWNDFASCQRCGDNGVIICTRGEEPGFWAFRCNCLRGDEDHRRGIPQFNKYYESEYAWVDPRKLRG